MKKDEIPRLLASGLTVAEVAAKLGTHPRYVRKIAKPAEVPYSAQKSGPKPLATRQALSPWRESVGRWLELHSSEIGTPAEVAPVLGLSLFRYYAACAGAADLIMTELMKLVEVLGQPLPEMTAQRPRFRLAG